MPEIVHCVDCGFLSLRHRETASLLEADWDFRSTGTAAADDVQQLPICFARKARFDREVRDYNEENPRQKPDQTSGVLFVSAGERPESIVAVIESDRDCDSFVPWEQGFSPKEHREMLDRRLIVEREDRLRKEAQEREDRLRRESQERDDALRKEMVRREDERDRLMREREDRRDEVLRRAQEKLHSQEMRIIGGVVTVTLVVGAIAAAIVEGAVARGWEPGWWPF